MFLNEDLDKIPEKNDNKIPISQITLQKLPPSPEKPAEPTSFYKSIEFTPTHQSPKSQKSLPIPELKKSKILKNPKTSFDSFEKTEKSLSLQKKITLNFKEMDKSQKTVFFTVFTISSIIYILCSIYIFQKFFFEKLKKSTKTKFFCFGLDFLEGEDFCVISVAQKAFGVFAFGQIAVGVFAVGQVSLGFFTIGQVSFGFFFCYLGQVCVGAVCWYSMCCVSWVFARKGMLGSCPVRPLFFKEKKPFVFCCD